MKDAEVSFPRVGFLGLGWIGRHRLDALARSGAMEIAALADPDPEAVRACARVGGGAVRGSGLADVLATEPDGVVIATPSALHASQSIAALEAGAAVFCQKPLGRTAGETGAVIAAAHRADRLVATDLSYRHTAAMQAIHAAVQEGHFGTPTLVDLTFHNAYGPDKPWFRNRALSGGGCLIDLGIHLVDLALWLMEWPAMRCTSAQLFAGGRRISSADNQVEDLVVATFETDAGAVIRLACSWNLPAGSDAVIRTEVYGSRGGAMMSNVGGSFYDFEAHLFDGCARRPLAAPPDDWGGRAALDWLGKLGRGGAFDPDCERVIRAAEAIDAVYAAA